MLLDMYRDFKIEFLSYKLFKGEYKDFASINPVVNRIVILSNHILRLIPMIALMEKMPFSFATKSLIMLTSSLYYRVTIERLCPFKFSLISSFGAISYIFAKTRSFSALSCIPLAAYTIVLLDDVFSSNRTPPSCCST